jgi:pimeloyl-ACP methyl ester carboxylesterase
MDPPKAYLRYLDIPGPEPPIVYMHGLGCAATVDFAVVASRPQLAGRRHLLIDFFGHGYSDAPDDFSYTLEDHAHSVRALLDEIGVRECVLFGHSMGGAIAITLAATQPGLVSHLVLAESNLDPGGGLVSADLGRHAVDQVPGLIERFLTEGRLSVSRVATFRAAAPVALQRSAVSLVAGTLPTMRERLYALNMPRAHIYGERSLPDPDRT